MDLETLRWFQEVADGSTVTEVAETYRISQPAVSRALARLEREAGTALFRRSGRVLRLTEAGAAFKRHVDPAVHALDDGVAAVQQLLDPESGRVAVLFQPSLGTWLVPDLVAAFRRDHPKVTFELTRADGTPESTKLIDGQVDLEFTARRPASPLVHTRRLFREPLALAVPTTHPLADRGEVWLTDAADCDFVMPAPTRTLRQLTDEVCADAGFTPRVAFIAEDLPTIRGFVAAGLGVAVLPAGGTDPSIPTPDGVRLVPLADRLAGRDINLAWAAQRRLLPSAELFRRFVLSEFRVRV